MPTGMQRVEIGNSVSPQDYSFPIDDELVLPVLQRGLDNPGTPGPIVSASSDEPHTIAVSLNTQAITRANRARQEPLFL